MSNQNIKSLRFSVSYENILVLSHFKAYKKDNEIESAGSILVVYLEN